MAGSANATRTLSAPRFSIRSFFQGSADVAVPRLWFVVAVLVLTILGLVMVYSSSTIEALNEEVAASSYFVRQLGIAFVGIILAVVIALAIPYYVWLDRWIYLVWAAAVLLLLATAVMGVVGLGAQRWLTLGPITFQPSELVKVALVLVAARLAYFFRIGVYDLGRFTLFMFIFVLAPLGLLFVTQSDLGTTAIIIMGVLAVLWLADTPLPQMLGLLALVALFAVAAVAFKAYRADRLVFLNPEADYYGAGYQLSRSFYAFGEGGLFGVGLGNSTEKYLYLPEAETDFIFAIIGEELGLVGALVVVVLFLVLLWAGLRIARMAPDSFGTMVAGGATVMLVFQAFMNMACVVGMLPTTGKPLPFISYGGTSLLGSYLLVGLVLSVSFASGENSKVYERRRDNLRIVSAAPAASAASTASLRDDAPRSPRRGFALFGRSSASGGRAQGANAGQSRRSQSFEGSSAGASRSSQGSYRSSSKTAAEARRARSAQEPSRASRSREEGGRGTSGSSRRATQEHSASSRRSRSAEGSRSRRRAGRG